MLSPTLFIIFIVDIEEELLREQSGGLVVGRRKFCSQAYADDIMVVAKREEELELLMRKLEKYLDRKMLTLNAEKSKVMVFKKGRGGRERKWEWKWKGKQIETFREFVYLGVRFQSSGK